MAKEMIRQFFTPQIMKMGEALVKKGAVSLTKQTDGRFEAEVKDGRKSYSVKVSGNFSDGSIEFDCECEYFTSSGHNCKHLAALACCVGDEKLFGDPSSEEPFFNVEGLFSELFDFDYRELNKVKEEVIRQKLGVTYHVTNENGNPDDWEVEFCVDTKGKFFGNQRCKCRLRRNIVVSLTCEGSIDKECAMSELAHGKFYLDPAKRHKPCIHKMALYVVLTSVLAEYDINPYTNLKAGRMLRELEEADEKETDREALQVDMLPVLSLRDFSITVRVFRNGKSLICPDIGPMLDFFDSGDEYGVRDDMKIDFSSDYLSDGALKVIRFCSS
ncbi:MAG: SWIM zinc finger domain-containing protein, partial [Bullifex sp.]